MSVIECFIKQQIDYAGGRAFGGVGSYRYCEAEILFSFDPADSRNRDIVDLETAPRDSAGRVRCRANVSWLTPSDATRGNGTLLLDVPNRGRRLSITQFNRVPRTVAAEDPLHPGDGFLFERGYSLATVGWQWDIPKDQGFWLDAPQGRDQDGGSLRGQVVTYFQVERRVNTLPIALPYAPADLHGAAAALVVLEGDGVRSIPRDQWQFARVREGRKEASGRHVTLRDGFEPGARYRLTFEAEGCVVAGVGLLAIRDAGEWLRGASTPLKRRPERAIALGVSQTGRFLRHFLYLGLNRSSTATKVFDGALIHIAGGQRGDFNHRFAVPGALGAEGPAQLFPFAASSLRDPLTGQEDGLLTRSDASSTTPKVFITNTAYEYWRGDGSLPHIDATGQDIPEHPLTRVYAFAGTQHIGGVFPPANENPLIPMKARYSYSIVDQTPLMRAALTNMEQWIRAGKEPPPSQHPRRSDGSARTRAAVLGEFARWWDQQTLDPLKLERFQAVNLSPQAKAVEHPLQRLGEYSAFVSSLDDDFNEVAAVRLPEVEVPLGTHTGWNPRHPETGALDEAVIFAGMTRFFAPDAHARAAARDPRRSIADRYASRDHYLAKVRDAAERMVHKRWLLPQDVDWIVERCGKHWDHVLPG